jgi:hypothetical protein
MYRAKVPSRVGHPESECLASGVRTALLARVLGAVCVRLQSGDAAHAPVPHRSASARAPESSSLLWPDTPGRGEGGAECQSRALRARRGDAGYARPPLRASCASRPLAQSRRCPHPRAPSLALSASAQAPESSSLLCPEEPTPCGWSFVTTFIALTLTLKPPHSNQME